MAVMHLAGGLASGLAADLASDTAGVVVSRWEVCYVVRGGEKGAVIGVYDTEPLAVQACSVMRRQHKGIQVAVWRQVGPECPVGWDHV